MFKIFQKILVIGGIHGNEPLGIELAQKIAYLNMPNLNAIYGNLAAIEKRIRYVEKDLNRVFDLPDENSIEKSRAAEILSLIMEGDYDLILDFHNTTAVNNDCTFVGKNFDQILLNVSEFLGLKNVVIANYNCINNYVKNCISIEISLTSELNNSTLWLNKILNLLNKEVIPQANSINKYQYKQRISKSEQKDLGLEGWKAFNEISDLDKEKLGLDNETNYFSIFVDESAYLPDNYAGLLTKLL